MKNTKYTFIDTSIFISENFIEGKKLNQLFELGNKGCLNLIITQITYNEILANARLRILEEGSTIKNLRVLRNIDGYEALKRKNDAEKSLMNLKQKLDEKLIFGKVQTLDYMKINIQNVFDKYFQNLPPFKEGNKKHEFPDAFSLTILKEWCQKEKRVCYILSNDKDMGNVYPEFFIYESIENKFAKLIDRYTREYEKVLHNQDRLDFIDKLYEKYTDQILENLKSELSDKICYDLFYSGSYKVIEDVEDLTIEDLEIFSHYIVEVNSIDAKIELQVKLKFNADVIVKDYSTAYYDKEDNTWFSVETKLENVREIIALPIILQVNHNPPAGKAFADIEIYSINDEKEIRI